MCTGDIAESRAHLDRGVALYDPIEHRPLATRFGQDGRVAILSWRSLALWWLGYPEAALADAEHTLKDAREIGHAATLMYALAITNLTDIFCGNYAAANARVDELIVLAEEKGALLRKAEGLIQKGCVRVLIGKASDAAQMITSGITAWQSTGSTMWMPFFLSHLARAHTELGKFEDAWRSIGEAITTVETTKERWCEAEVYRTAGEITLLAPERDTAKAEAHFKCALEVARAQQAKSWELRAAMSMARLRRDQGKWDEARDLLAPVYNWFTEGFDTRDLKEAKALLDALTP
jgi:predicted ATPase